MGITNEEREKHIRIANMLIGVINDVNTPMLMYQIEKDVAREALENYVKMLEQQPKTGRWLDKKTTIKGGHGLAYGRYGCSVCKKKQSSKTDFCPNCGADMRGEGE